MIDHARCADKGVGRGHVGEGKYCARVRGKLFWRAIYCSKPRPDPKFRSGSLHHRVLGSLDLRIKWGYNLATLIEIWPLNQPHMCEMGSLGFSATSRLKFKSTTRSPFPRMPSTESTNKEKWFFHSYKCLPCLSLF